MVCCVWDHGGSLPHALERVYFYVFTAGSDRFSGKVQTFMDKA